MTPSLLDQIEWYDDRFVLAGRTFRLQHQMEQNVADDAFVFYKSRAQVEQLDRFLRESAFTPDRVLELGIWDGGSAAFWTETLDLDRYVAIDLQTRGDSAYFESWRDERARGRVSTHWGVSQADRSALDDVLRRSGIEQLDLVLDDCSHQYGPTLASFDHLFPMVRPGGWYVIEDWAWDLQPEFQPRDHPWGVHPSLHPLALELVRACGAHPDVIPSVRVFPDFVAVERGVGPADDFSLQRLHRRRRRPWASVAYRNTRAAAGSVKRRVGRS